MAYSEKTANRIREALSEQKNVEEKKMFQGLCFMVDGKMCICIRNDEIMCRLDPEKYEAVLEEKNCRPMVHNGKTMKGFVFVDDKEIKNPVDLAFWVEMALEYNKKSKASPKKRRK